ncbi:MAG TPA: hypothetical protein VIH28_00590 [Ignavibacteriaceae bacterium]
MTGLSIKLTIIFIVLFQTYLNSQSFGFGCLGFTGGYAGYSHQKYQPDGLNDYIKIFNLNRKDSLTENLHSFGSANGFRVGLNFFRKKFSGVFITAKGFYQFLNEKHQAVEKLSSGIVSTSNEVKMINWGLGIDLGTPIISFLNWKIIDAALLYNQARFSNTQNFPGALTVVNNYKSDYHFGYTIGTGIIIEILGEYITLEGLAAYSKITIDEMKMDDGTKLMKNENSTEAMKNFIADGGFNAVIQLNIGLPL